MGSLLQNTIFGKAKYTANTFIGGVAASLNTPALVAVKLGIASSRIKVFKIIGNDIEFAVIGGTYAIPNSAFDGDTNITYFDDADGLVTILNIFSFRNTTNLLYAKVKKAFSLGASAFQGSGIRGTDNDFTSVTSLSSSVFLGIKGLVTTIFTFPSLTNLNGTGIFTAGTNIATSNNVTFNIPVSFKTSNAGKPHASVFASSSASIVNYIEYIDTISYNTEFGAAFSSYGNKGLLAERLGIGSGGIVDFQNVSGTLRYTVLNNYKLGISSAFFGNTIITHYDDIAGLVTNIESYVFYGATNLNYVKVKNATLINAFCFAYSGIRGTNSDFTLVNTLYGNNSFANLVSPITTVITLPSLTTMTGTGVFTGDATYSNNITVNIPLAFKTSNAGLPNANLTTPSIRAVIINYIGWVDGDIYNTEIGNLGTYYPNKGLLAYSIGIGSGGIVNIQNISGNLRFLVLVNYAISSNAFLFNTTISYFDDSFSGMVSDVGTAAFTGSSIQSIKLYGIITISGRNCIDNCTKLNTFEMPNLITFAADLFGRSCPLLLSVSYPNVTKVTANTAFSGASIKNIHLPACTQLGNTVGDNSVFNSLISGATITVKSSLQTVNAGAPDGDLVYAASTRGANIVYV